MVEHRIPNPGVAGSSPPTPATHILLVKQKNALFIIDDIFTMEDK